MFNTSSFLYPQSHYYGEVKPENLVFNANLQEFAQRVSYISSMAGNGKIPMEQAIQTIEALWEQLVYTKQQLGVGENPFQSEDQYPE